MSYELDIKGMEQMLEKFSEKTERVGPIINEVLWKEGAEEIKKDIKPLIPISDRRKKHAAESQPFTQRNGTLSVTVQTTGKWGYLVFPDEGRGKHNPTAHEFMLKGGEAATSNIVRAIEEKVADEINK